jgi:hypothetical protein
VAFLPLLCAVKNLHIPIIFKPEQLDTLMVEHQNEAGKTHLERQPTVPVRAINRKPHGKAANDLESKNAT